MKEKNKMKFLILLTILFSTSSYANSRFKVGDCFVLTKLNLPMKVFLVADSGYLVIYKNSTTYRLEWSPISNEEVSKYNGVKQKCPKEL
jgi:hypothetical protein